MTALLIEPKPVSIEVMAKLTKSKPPAKKPATKETRGEPERPMQKATPKPRPGKPRSRLTAEAMAAMQRDISVSEFFAKNRHLLGFDNPRKALLTTVKEAVDNALDACEEA